MAIRYAMPRESIASATLPADIIKNYYARLDGGQKEMIVRDLREHFERVGRFGDSRIDNPVWQKFLAALDTPNHKIATLSDETKVIVFKANGRLYPRDHYLEMPWHETYILSEEVVELV